MSDTTKETTHIKTPLRRVAIDPVTRVEGHGKVTLLVDEHNQVQQARFHIVEFRGFEKFIQGRPFWEAPMVVQRLCGICPVSHHLAAAKAIDQIAGVKQLSPAALKLRQLMHFGQTLQSHALHFFHLSSPDLLFGMTSPVNQRNIVAVIDQFPDLALKGVKIRRYGQEVIKAVSGKKIHGMTAMPGGMNKSLSQEEMTALKKEINDVVSWTYDAVQAAKQLYLNDDSFKQFARIKSPFLSLVSPEGNLELYHGGLRVKESHGAIFKDHFDYVDYTSLLEEEIKSWSYMKFPFLIEKGNENGWYRVGPLARVNNCDQIPTPKAEAERKDYLAHHQGLPDAPLAYHWARMIEALHCAESIQLLLTDEDLLSQDLLRSGEKQATGVGVIEAPRGTLFHDYVVNEDDQIIRANLIVSTTSNNQAMNESVRRVANDQLNGLELTPELLNQVEVAIRAYDPCLSCATHSLGKMPLQIELMDMEQKLISKIEKQSSGEIVERSVK